MGVPRCSAPEATELPAAAACSGTLSQSCYIASFDVEFLSECILAYAPVGCFCNKLNSCFQNMFKICLPFLD